MKIIIPATKKQMECFQELTGDKIIQKEFLPGEGATTAICMQAVLWALTKENARIGVIGFSTEYLVDTTCRFLVPGGFKARRIPARISLDNGSEIEFFSHRYYLQEPSRFHSTKYDGICLDVPKSLSEEENSAWLKLLFFIRRHDQPTLICGSLRISFPPDIWWV